MELAPVINLPLEDSELDDIIDKMKDYCLMNGNEKPPVRTSMRRFSSGICMRRRLNGQLEEDSLSFAPILLFPSPFPKNEFGLGVQMQKDLNVLMHKVAFDGDFLKETLKETVKVDDFTAKLMEIQDEIRKEPLAQVIKSKFAISFTFS